MQIDTSGNRHIWAQEQVARKGVIIGSQKSEWRTVNGNTPSTTDSAGVTVNPTTLIAVTDLTSRVITAPFGTSLIVRLAYSASVTTVATNPTIQVLAIDRNGAFYKLMNSSGNQTAAVTTTIATDLKDATYYYTDVTKEQIFDLQGAAAFMILNTRGCSTLGATSTLYQYKVV